MPSAPSGSGDSEYSEDSQSQSDYNNKAHSRSEYDSESGSESGSSSGGSSSSINSKSGSDRPVEKDPSKPTENEAIFYEDLMTSSESGGSDKETPVREKPADTQAASEKPSRKSRKKRAPAKGPLQGLTDSNALEKLIAELRERQQLLQTLASVPGPPPPPPQPQLPPSVPRPPPPKTAAAKKGSSSVPSVSKGLTKARRDQLRRLNGLKKILDKAVVSYNDLAVSLESSLSD